jgi:oligo-1,6-glucosidase
MKQGLFFLLLLVFHFSCNENKKEITSSKLSDTKAFREVPDRAWWKEAIVYQIYPRSFKDSDGDGVGDLKGIVSKLDYLEGLGIDIIWLNPIYGSPNADNGYDISDYQTIMKEFGTMQDFDNLLKGLHDRGIKLVMDLVVNHCSDEHEWFKQSRSSRMNPYRNYFHWWPAEKGKPPFRPGAFEVDGSGWRFDSLTNAYYLHYFSYRQPDLNWENPAVRQEIYKMMRSWFDKGVDGFRMDVIPFISKDTSFPVITQKDINEKYNGQWDQYLASGPYLHDHLQEMNREVLSKYDVMALAEGAGTTKATAMNFVDPARKELNMSYHFEGMNLGYIPGAFKRMDPKGYSLPAFKKIYSDWDSVFASKGWGTIYLGNHDQPRMLTRWGNDAPQFREYSSKLLSTFLLSMRGTPYYYQGDELGMSNIKFDSISQYRDIESIAAYGKTKNEGGDLQRFLNDQKISARDNGRTPFQWDNSNNAGFTTGTPWIKINENYTTVNAAAQEKDPNSILNYFRKLTVLRKNSPALIYGAYKIYNPEHEQVYAYTRTQGKEQMLVIMNFSNVPVIYPLPSALKNYTGATALLNNYPEFTIDKPTASVSLKPWQAIILKSN